MLACPALPEEERCLYIEQATIRRRLMEADTSGNGEAPTAWRRKTMITMGYWQQIYHEMNILSG